MAVYKASGVVINPRKQHTLPYDKVLPVGFLDDKEPEDVAKYGISKAGDDWVYEGAAVVLPLSIPRERTFTAGALLKYTEADKDSLPKMLTDCGITIEADPAPTAAPAPTLDELKARKMSEVNARTQELLNEGFTYGGKTFDPHPERDGKRWAELGTLTALGMTIYPLTVYAINKESVDLADEAEVKAFLASYVGYREGVVMQEARSLEKRIDAAADETALSAIVDGR